MSALQEQTIAVGAQKARIFRGGKSGAPAALFLHGGVPGVTPYCGGSHIWGDALASFTNNLDVIAPDLPGSGGTVAGTEPLTVDAIGRHVLAFSRRLQSRRPMSSATILAGSLAYGSL